MNREANTTLNVIRDAAEVSTRQVALHNNAPLNTLTHDEVRTWRGTQLRAGSAVLPRISQHSHGGGGPHSRRQYHINVVDTVTQWQVVGCVEAISERYL